jgi:hypothetical protein
MEQSIKTKLLTVEDTFLIEGRGVITMLLRLNPARQRRSIELFDMADRSSNRLIAQPDVA